MVHSLDALTMKSMNSLFNPYSKTFQNSNVYKRDFQIDIRHISGLCSRSNKLGNRRKILIFFLQN